jgi:hypothetical protein
MERAPDTKKPARDGPAGGEVFSGPVARDSDRLEKPLAGNSPVPARRPIFTSHTFRR